MKADRTFGLLIKYTTRGGVGGAGVGGIMSMALTFLSGSGGFSKSLPVALAGGSVGRSISPHSRGVGSFLAGGARAPANA